MKRAEALPVAVYLAKRKAYLRAARLYTHAFDRFADGDCTELELAQAECDLDRAVMDVVDAGKAAGKELAP